MSDSTLLASIPKRYRVVRTLGRGAAGVVFEGLELETGRTVALKVLTQESALASLERFRQEAQHLELLRHPHIVEILGFSEDPRGACLITEFLPGGNLGARRKQGPLPEETLRQVVRGILEGLAHAHQAGVIHRDLKPENILLDAKDEAKLADFGLVTSARAKVQTATGWILGTPEAMPPEVFRGEEAGPAADIWAFGSVLWYLEFGTPRFRGSVAEISSRVLSGELPRPPENSRWIPWIEACHSLDPEARPSAKELLQELSPESLRSRGATRVHVPKSSAEPHLDSTRVLSSGPPPSGLDSSEPPKRWFVPWLLLGALALILAGSQAGSRPEGPAGAELWKKEEERTRKRALWKALLEDFPRFDLAAEVAAHAQSFLPRSLDEDCVGRHFAASKKRLRENEPLSWDLFPEFESSNSLQKAQTWLRARGSEVQNILTDADFSPEERQQLASLVEQLESIEFYRRIIREEPDPLPYSILQEWIEVQRKFRRSPFTPRPSYSVSPQAKRKFRLAGESSEIQTLGSSDLELYRWFEAPKRLYPFLIHDTAEPTLPQRAASRVAKAGAPDRFDLRDYGPVLRSFEIEAPPAGKVLWVELHSGNLYYGDRFRVRLDDFERSVDSLGLPIHRLNYHSELGPEVVHWIRFPPEASRPGVHTLRVSVLPPPGMRPCVGADLHRIVLRWKDPGALF